MSWFSSAVGSSVGKKLFMALTGIALLGFLAAHLAGNFSIYAGRAAFDGYAEKLRSLGPLLHAFRAGLILLAVVHITTGLVLFFQNRGARPADYAAQASAGGQTLSSRTMPYTGLLILAFAVFHLFHFTWVGQSPATVFDRVTGAFNRPEVAALYVGLMIVVALHVRHGFWSALQTLGVHHPKYTPAVYRLSIAAGWTVAIGYGLLPVAVAVLY